VVVQKSIVGALDDDISLSCEANRNYPAANFNLAAALARFGRMDEAYSAVIGGLEQNPTFSISRVRRAWTARSDDPTYLAQLEPIFDGLRLAGAPHG
jgi:hypothetical protein